MANMSIMFRVITMGTIVTAGMYCLALLSLPHARLHTAPVMQQQQQETKSVSTRPPVPRPKVMQITPQKGSGELLMIPRPVQRRNVAIEAAAVRIPTGSFFAFGSAVAVTIGGMALALARSLAPRHHTSPLDFSMFTNNGCDVEVPLLHTECSAWDPLDINTTSTECTSDISDQLQVHHGRIAMFSTLGLLTEGPLHQMLLNNFMGAGIEPLYLPVLAGFWMLMVPFLFLCEWPAIGAFEQLCEAPVKAKKENEGFDPLGLKTTSIKHHMQEVHHGRIAMFSTLGLLTEGPFHQMLLNNFMGAGIEPLYLPVLAGMWALMVPFLFVCELPAIEAYEHICMTPAKEERHIGGFDPLGLRDTSIIYHVRQQNRWDPLSLATAKEDDGASAVQHGRLALFGTLGALDGDHWHHLLLGNFNTAGIEAMYLPIFAGFWMALIPFLLLCEWPNLEALEHEAPVMLKKVPLPIDPNDHLNQ